MPANPVTVPVSIFDEQMDAAPRARLHASSSSTRCSTTTSTGKPLPRAGGADHLRRRLPRQPRERRADPRELRLPGGALRADRLSRRPPSAAARGAPRGAGHPQPDARLERARRARARGRPHRVARDRATARSPTSRSTRPRARSRSRSSGSRSGSAGRCGRSPTSRAPRRTTSPCISARRQAGYDVAFTSISGANSQTTDPLQLHRYNVEPYPPRTFELVLAGACDLIALKDTVAGTHARRLFNAALGTSTK